jgi:hypothetical protein
MQEKHNVTVNTKARQAMCQKPPLDVVDIPSSSALSSESQ